MSQPPPSPLALVFDFDGTLAELNIDFGHMAQEVEALARGLGFADPWPGGYLLEAVDKVAGVLGDGFPAKAEEAIRQVEMDAARRGGLLAFCRPLLAHLRQGGLATAIISRNCGPAIRLAFPDIDQRCDAFLPRELCPRLKPDPAQVLQALDVLGVAPDRAWMVGDHPTDMVAGRDAGCYCLGVTSGRSGVDELKRAGAGLVLANAGALQTMLGG